MRLENEAGNKGNLFKAVKHIVKEGKDVVGNSSTYEDHLGRFGVVE